MFSSEILLEERVSDCETMKRENRRVAAMSWGGDDTPPPKPTRVPQTDSLSMLSLGEGSSTPQTYIIAQNAAVLAQLMRENENRPLNPSAYTTPASVFNTLAVDIDASKSEPQINESPILPLKTLMLPACELLKLNPMIENESDSIPTNLINVVDQTQTIPSQFQSQMTDFITQPHHIHQSQVINTLSQQIQTLQTSDACDNSNISQHLTPRTGDSIMKSRSLERNLQPNVSYVSRISSLDRTQNSALLKQVRSNSLTRKLNFGNETSIYPGVSFTGSMRSASLERGTQIGANYTGYRSDSFDCSNGPKISSQYAQFMPNEAYNWGSLERNQPVNNAQNIIMTPRNPSFDNLESKQQGILNLIQVAKSN